ncbi:XrtA/PEP-CTERM system TPR-repeat protein PrsT [Ectothiorhodospira lacustris]|uniref:XrtA/PEP-CTERM system TPR-repeat protein PrsT n=1 Tax=Ectothiorhodospira lacustris TaxID=2899127 RepID=UPI001EE904C0|nr:XrtA/PEP-CTERM system TPR-repeat protein PrsT [Ectothiorhodospira lacustris]MCG5509643.1 PEP-CTERM system TPR-repeat protein PrsT [Ectothiorhodospira lacustris]MCG5521562.1 PEP-CTERM system TPR-repeat protein PrsT [Ectothiorhodospira lacustris]
MMQKTLLSRSVTALILLPALMLGGCGQTSYSADERMERALTFQAEGDLRAGMIEYRNILQTEPNHVEARWRLGVAHLELGEAAAAEGEFRRAMHLGWDAPEAAVLMARAQQMQGRFDSVVSGLDPDRLQRPEDIRDAEVLMGWALLGLERPDDAADAFRKALELAPHHAPALTGLAQVHLLKGEIDRARLRLTEALEHQPDYTDAWDLLGEIFRTQGRLDDAEQAFTRMIESAAMPYMGHFKRALTRIARQNWEGANEDHRALVRLGNDLPATAYIDGMIRFHGRDFQGAVRALETALRGNPGYLPALFFAGAAHYALGNLQQADTHLGRFVRVQPDSVAANRLLAAVRLQAGQVEDAEVLLDRALARDPADLLALELMAGVHAMRGDAAAGIGLLRERVALDPESIPARMRLARALIEGGERVAGLKELESLQSLIPDEQMLELATVVRLLEERNFQEALTLAQELDEKQPDRAALSNLIGVAHLGLGDLAQGRESFERARRQEPGNLIATRNLAVLAMQMEGPDQARQILESSLQQRPDDHRLLLLLANLEENRGDRTRVGPLLERAVAAAPEALEPKILLARYYLNNDESRRAVSLLEGLRAANPDNPALLETLALSQAASGQVDNAITHLRRLTEIAPRNAETHYRLGLLQHQAGRPAEARGALARSLELDAEHLGALAALADLEREAGRPQEVLTLSRRLQSLEAGRAFGWLLEGDVHYAAESFGKAADAYESSYQAQATTESAIKYFEARRRAGDLQQARRLLAGRVDAVPADAQSRMVLGTSFLETEEYDRALPHYEILVEQVPGNAILLNNLAFMYLRQGDERALAMAREAHRLAPEIPHIQDTLGMALLAQGDTVEALRLIQAAREALPDDPTIGYHHALALHHNQRSAEARAVLESLLAKSGAFSERAAAEALLSQLK